MNIIETTAELRRTLAPVRGRDHVAFVPTMGCLHEGHLSLIRKAKRLADIVVVSIYVNPMQFGPNEDFDAYPRTFEADAALCEKEGVDIIFHPANLYPADGIKVSLKVDELDDCLCGTSRPGHFDGVITVVNMLFNIVQPDIAIFGEKDWQQLAIITRMVGDLQMGIEVVGAPTLRESDGLAMSSRNRYLSGECRSKAAQLYKALQLMKSRVEQGELESERLIESVKAQLTDAGIMPEYLEIRDAVTLQIVTTINTPCRIFIAAKIGNARLIDNIALESATDRVMSPVTEPAMETLL